MRSARLSPQLTSGGSNRRWLVRAQRCHDPRDLLLTEPYVSECLLAFNDARALRRMHPRSKTVREHVTCTEVEVARGLRRLLRPPLRELRFSWAPSCRVSDERSPGFLAPVVFARSASGPTVLQAFQVTPAVLRHHAPRRVRVRVAPLHDSMEREYGKGVRKGSLFAAFSDGVL